MNEEELQKKYKDWTIKQFSIKKGKNDGLSGGAKFGIALLVIIGIILWAKTGDNSFTLVWRYFNFVNQLIAVPTFLYASVYLYNNGKNYFMTLIPGLFYIFITAMFILNNKIGFNLSYKVSGILAFVIVLISLIAIYKTKLCKK